MSLFHWRWRFAAAAGGLVFASATLLAQSTGTQGPDSAPNEKMRALEQRIDKLADNLAAAQGQVEEDRRRMQAMQTEIDDLRKSLKETGRESTSPEVASATAQLQQAVTQIREEQEVISSQVQQHEQTNSRADRSCLFGFTALFSSMRL